MYDFHIRWVEIGVVDGQTGNGRRAQESQVCKDARQTVNTRSNIYGNSNDVDIRKITLFSTSITFHSVPECNDRFN